MINVRPIVEKDHAAICALVDELPEWFHERTRKHAIPTDLKHQIGYVAEESGVVQGFITLYIAEGRLNIGWMGVRRDSHRRGIGGMLITQAEQAAREMELEELATYTLGDKEDYPPYEPTRAFYWKHGFSIYQRSQTDNPGCPDEIRISKKITRDPSDVTRIITNQ